MPKRRRPFIDRVKKIHEKMVAHRKAQEEAFEDSIVKVYTQAKEYNYCRPWESPSIEKWIGSGFVISDNRILTNAHVVQNHTFIEVRLANEALRYTAKVKSIGYDCDLAILEVENPDFWIKAQPLEFGEMPNIRDEVSVYGFPTGGVELSITKGIVSRIEIQEYVNQSMKLLTAQIDAAINPGNSGGPVISGHRVVGVVHQSIHYSQNLGYIIPASVVLHFIQDSDEHKPPRGFPDLAISTQALESEDLRGTYGLKPDQSGVRVVSVAALSAAHQLIQEDDVLLKINDYIINNDRTIKHESGKRIDFNFVVQDSFLGDMVIITLLRKKKERVVQIKLTNAAKSTHIVPPKEFDKAPTYYIASGVVLQPLTTNYLEDGWGNPYNAPSEFVSLFKTGKKTKPNEEVVMLNRILASPETAGYTHVSDEMIKSINGKQISCIKEAVESIESNRGTHHTFVTQGNQKIVIKNLTEKEHRAILEKYDIHFDRSKDLRRPGALSPMAVKDNLLLFSKKRIPSEKSNDRREEYVKEHGEDGMREKMNEKQNEKSKEKVNEKEKIVYMEDENEKRNDPESGNESREATDSSFEFELEERSSKRRRT